MEIKFIRLFIFTFISFLGLNCSFQKFNNESQEFIQNSNFKKGDLLIIELKDKTKIDCVFVGQDSCLIHIKTLDNKISQRDSIIKNDIRTIKLKGENPKKILTFIIALSAFSLFIFASYLSGLGNLRP